ncbi:Tripartite motif-containing protein 65 [Manis javanica]|nr:Tripartite motif-containing protein 65 [Manis javanica]
MATQLLEDKLTCAICVGLYQDSVTLLCGHFCRTCIRDWWSRREMACPECQEPVADRAEPPRKVAISGVLERVHRARVSSPRAGTAGRRAPGARGPAESRAGGHPATGHPRLKSQLQELPRRSSQIQSSACTLASMVSGKFSCLLQALEMQQALARRDVELDDRTFLQATGPLTPVPSQLCPWRRKLGRVSACTCVTIGI